MKAINTTIFKAAFIILVFAGTFVGGHPVDVAAKSSKPPVEDAGDRYDQRQNGTENYRIQVDGVVLVIAPAETLFMAAGLGGVGDPDFFALGQDALPEADSSKPGAADKPKPQVEDVPKSQKEKLSPSPSLRLVNLLAPLFRRAQH